MSGLFLLILVILSAAKNLLLLFLLSFRSAAEESASLPAPPVSPKIRVPILCSFIAKDGLSPLQRRPSLLFAR